MQDKENSQYLHIYDCKGELQFTPTHQQINQTFKMLKFKK